MARRYSGHFRIDVALAPKVDGYTCRIFDGGTGERTTVAVLFPGVITKAVDSPEAYDAAARAALSFAADDGEIDGERAAHGKDGWHVGRDDAHAWPAPCTYDAAAAARQHAALKASPEWSALPLVGTQPKMGDVGAMELRNCPHCGSTLTREV